LRFEERLPRRAVQDATGLSAMQVRTREKRLRRQLATRLDSAGYSRLAAQSISILILAILPAVRV
jgi:hypothetical protein